MCQMFTLLLIDSHCFIINPVIAARTLPPQLLIANRHSIRYPHTLSPLNDDGSHGSTICPSSMIMDPMSTNYVPLIDNGYHGSTLFPTQLWWIPCLTPFPPPSMMMDPSWWRGSLLHPCTTPHLGDFSFSLFYDILTPPLFNIQYNH